MGFAIRSQARHSDNLPEAMGVVSASAQAFDALGFPFSLRTFQTSEALKQPRINHCLNARAALAYCRDGLPDSPQSWALYLEDDVELSDELPGTLPLLVEQGNALAVDCWYVCNRKNPVRRQFHLGEWIVNELDHPIVGTHGLLLPRRHLKAMLARHWRGYFDGELFAALRPPEAKVLQIVQPALVEHVGKYSTFHPQHPQNLEINHANPSNSCAAE